MTTSVNSGNIKFENFEVISTLLPAFHLHRFLSIKRSAMILFIFNILVCALTLNRQNLFEIQTMISPYIPIEFKIVY